MRPQSRLLVFVLGILVLAGIALANSDHRALAVGTQVRTFVASTGSDSNPCSRTSPCRTFAAALAQTASGGDIVALDTGGYGTLTITQSVSVVAAPGVQAFISPSSGAAITVSAGANDRVILQNLTLNSPTANVGVLYESGGSLQIDGLTINGFNVGIYGFSTGQLDVQIANTVVVGSTHGISFGSSSAGHGTIVRTRVEGNPGGNAVEVSDNWNVSARDVVVTRYFAGFYANANSTSGSAVLAVEGCTVTHSAQALKAAGNPLQSATATMRVSNCMITGNDLAVATFAGGSILTRGNNTIENNSSDGTFSGSFSGK